MYFLRVRQQVVRWVSWKTHHANRVQGHSCVTKFIGTVFTRNAGNRDDVSSQGARLCTVLLVGSG